MMDIVTSANDGRDEPPCRRCGAKTRLFGIESHPLIGQLDVLSYVCVDCEAVRVDMATLPRAWGQLPLHRKEAMPMAKFLTSRAFDPETTSLLGAAFDKAWQTVQTSGSPLADEKHAAATREILARNILAAGHRDRDINQLVEEALALLIISNDTSARGADMRAKDAEASAVERHS